MPSIKLPNFSAGTLKLATYDHRNFDNKRGRFDELSTPTISPKRNKSENLIDFIWNRRQVTTSSQSTSRPCRYKYFLFIAPFAFVSLTKNSITLLLKNLNGRVWKQLHYRFNWTYSARISQGQILDLLSRYIYCLVTSKILRFLNALCFRYVPAKFH